MWVAIWLNTWWIFCFKILTLLDRVEMESGEEAGDAQRQALQQSQYEVNQVWLGYYSENEEKWMNQAYFGKIGDEDIEIWYEEGR